MRTSAVIGAVVAICSSGKFGRLAATGCAVVLGEGGVVAVFVDGVSGAAFCVGEGSSELRITTASMTCGRNNSGGSPATETVVARLSIGVGGIGVPSVRPLPLFLVWPGIISMGALIVIWPPNFSASLRRPSITCPAEYNTRAQFRRL